MDAATVTTSAAPHFVSDPQQYRHLLFDLLRHATREILLEFYIFEDDEFGERLLAALLEAAGRGVEVRLLVDGFGSEAWLRRKRAELRELPLQIRIYHPLPWTMASLRHGHLPFSLLEHLATSNRRDHRKLFLVDGQQAVMGSHNIWNQSLVWHEASLHLDGNCASAMRDSFERVWRRCSTLEGRRWRFQRPLRRNPVAGLLASGCPGVLDNTTLGLSRLRNRTILELIARAEKRLWITTPYLCPHRSLLRQIKARAEAGVDVRLILPQRSDVWFSRWIGQAIFRELLQSGVAIHEFTAGVLHAKVMVADDRFLLGSSNLNHRSFLQDLEIDYLGTEPALLDAIVQWKHDTLAQCEQVRDVAQVRLYALKVCLAALVNPLKVFF